MNAARILLILEQHTYINYEDAFGFTSDSHLVRKVVAVRASEDREVFFKNFFY